MSETPKLIHIWKAEYDKGLTKDGRFTKNIDCMEIKKDEFGREYVILNFNADPKLKEKYRKRFKRTWEKLEDVNTEICRRGREAIITDLEAVCTEDKLESIAIEEESKAQESTVAEVTKKVLSYSEVHGQDP